MLLVTLRFLFTLDVESLFCKCINGGPEMSHNLLLGSWLGSHRTDIKKSLGNCYFW